MITQDQLFLIGKINKPHGVYGEVTFTLQNNTSFDEDTPCLFVEIDGIHVPFFIEEMEFSTDTTGFLKFEDIETANDASLFTSLPLYIERKYIHDEDIETDDANYFIGFKLMDNKNHEIGLIQFIDTTTENHLFVIDKDGEEILIPVSEEYITDLDHDNKIIYMELPEGLLSL